MVSGKKTPPPQQQKSNNKIKVKADKPHRRNEKERPVVPAGMTFNIFHSIKASESKHLLGSPQRGSVPKPTAE